MFAGPTGPSVAGYLTAGTRSTMPDKPPPLDHHDENLYIASNVDTL